MSVMLQMWVSTMSSSHQHRVQLVSTPDFFISFFERALLNWTQVYLCINNNMNITKLHFKCNISNNINSHGTCQLSYIKKCIASTKLYNKNTH